MSRFTNSVHKLKNFIFGDENYVTFIVLSIARTGSNLLRSYLNNHPDIHVEGEILKKINSSDSQKIIDNCWSPQPKHFKAIGFKLFYSHPFDESDKNSWKPILTKRNLHIIHLKRHNAIRSFKSERLAFINDEWLNNNPGHTMKKVPIYYNPIKLIQKLNRLEKEILWTETFFEDVPKFDIEYSELTHDHIVYRTQLDAV